MKKLLFCLSMMLFSTSIFAQSSNDALLLDMYQNQKYQEAATYLKSVYPEPITDMKVLSRFAYTYRMAGKLPDALAYYQRMYVIDSTNVPVLFSLAGINADRDNTNQALYYYSKITHIDSLNFTVNKQLGRLYATKNDTLNSLKYLRKANTINPDEQEVATELTGYLSFQKKYPEAERVLRRALQADTTNILLLRAVMRLNFAMNKYPETIKSCQKLLELGDNSADIYNKEGSSYYELKNYECCIDAFNLLPGIFQTERTLYLTAMSYKKLRDYPKAIDFLNQTLLQAISGNTYAYYNEIADTYQTMHQLKTAALNYQKSLFFEQKPIVIYTLASMYDQDLKDKKNALKYYKQYLASNPPAKQKEYVDYVKNRIAELKQ